MLKKLTAQEDTMALALVLWLCALPLVGLIVVPVFGFRAAAIVALFLLLASLAVCWGICGRRIRLRKRGPLHLRSSRWINRSFSGAARPMYDSPELDIAEER